MDFMLNCIIDVDFKISRLEIGGFSDCMHVNRSMVLVDRSRLTQNACRPVDVPVDRSMSTQNGFRPADDSCRLAEVDTEAVSTGRWSFILHV